MDLKLKIKKGIELGIISYDGDIVKFGRYAIGGISANNTEQLVDIIERCCYRSDFGGKEFIEKIALYYRNSYRDFEVCCYEKELSVSSEKTDLDSQIKDASERIVEKQASRKEKISELEC